MNTQISQALRAAVMDDAFAASFQTLGQYRQALVRILDGQAAELTAPQLSRSTGYRCAACCAPDGEPHATGCGMASVDDAARLAADMLSELDTSKLPLAVPAAIGVLRTTFADQHLSAAARDVLAERRRQVKAEGWTPEHDDQYTDFQMSRAAACYTMAGDSSMHLLSTWPWSWEWWKPRRRRENLVRATALLLAEIERMDRAEPNAQDGIKA